MLKIRLRRMGSKKDACYRIVVSDSRSTPRGRFVDVVGTYDPGMDPAEVKLDVPKAEAWIGKGAHPSPTVKSLLVRAKKAAAQPIAPV
jgi:small subunit ribosomal protein S16